MNEVTIYPTTKITAKNVGLIKCATTKPNGRNPKKSHIEIRLVLLISLKPNSMVLSGIISTEQSK